VPTGMPGNTMRGYLIKQLERLINHTTDLEELIKDLEKQMKTASRELEFEHAALLRDQLVELRRDLLGDEEALPEWSDQAYGRKRRPINRRKEPAPSEPTV